MTSPQITNISPPEKHEIEKLFRAYGRAEYALEKKRDEMFPAGCMVRSRLNDTEERVIDGSLYPNQIRTRTGHMSWRNLEKLP